MSDDLAAVVGTKEAPRHEVVKQMWAYIKENNLQDPKNKQFAICDEKLLKIIGTKKFKCFGMVKYLKNHMSSKARGARKPSINGLSFVALFS